MKSCWSGTAILLISGLTVLGAQDLSREAYNRYVGTSAYTFESEGPGQLIMAKIKGDITIVGQVGDQIKIEERVVIRSKSEERARELFDDSRAFVQRTSGENEPVAIQVLGRDVRRHSLSFDYAVTLPEVFSVQARTKGGDINIERLQGEMEVSTSGGDMELSNLSGKISATTSGGDIECVDLGGRVLVVTSGGDITLEEVRGELNATTSGGDISVEEVQGSISVNTSGGDIDLLDIVGREIAARTSGGDITAEDLTANTTIDLTTSGGNIEMEQIDGDIEASTSGGDIEMDEIRGGAKVWTSGGSIIGERILGALEARTSAGDIVVGKIWDRDLEDHEIDLKTSSGDIELTLPRDFSARFSIRAISPGGRPGEAIASDFPLTITATRAFARASGINGEGEFNVRLESSIGTITIFWEE